MQSLCRTIKDTIQNISKLGILPVCILAVSAFIIANAVPQSVLADFDAIALPGQQIPDGAKPDGGERFVHAPNESDRTRVSPSNSVAPYIVYDGVQMYQVRNAIEAGGWDFRAPGDDTYGNGELIVVSVEFNEPVLANNNTTFRIQIGTARRNLVPVSHRGETVLFGGLIRSTDLDTNGVWIGDNTATLDHNPANYIRSNPDEGDPVNANRTHSSLGTQSDHKVDGSKTRPKLKNIRITSSPQHADAYVRGETIEIEARFDRPVTVSGDVDLHLNVKAFQQTASRFAQYTEGTGTSTLVFQHVVTLFENDSDGIVIPKNALSQDGNLASGVHGGGSIVGQQGGLIADLSSRKRGPLAAHKVDARFASVPEIMSAVLWHWEDSAPVSDSLVMNFNIDVDPGHFSETDVLVAALAWGNIDNVRFAVGLRTDVDKPGTDGSQGKGIIFNRWGTTDTTSFARTTGDGWVETGSLGGPFISVRRSFDWSEGNYSLRVAQDGDDDSDGRWFGFWMTDKSTGVETKMGSLKFPLPEEGEPKIQARNHGIGSLIAILGDGAVKPHEIPVFEVALALPEASGGGLPNRATVSYSQLNGVMTNSNVGYDSNTGKVILSAGGDIGRNTPAGDLTGLATPQLTATTTNAPESHDGTSTFTFELTFSEEFPLSYQTLRDHAFNVTGGEVIGAGRLDRPSNIRWRIRVRPDSNDDVTVVLPVPEYCGAAGAICTADGRELSEAVTVTVPGPGSGN